MKRALHWYDTITINIYWLALSGISNTMTPLIVPLLVQQFVGDATKGTAYGNLRLWTLMVALLFQALFGILSDHSTLRFGRRRPFILTSSILDLAIMTLIGFTAGLSGITGYWLLFFLIILLSIASNMAQAAVNGLIPDLVPSNKRGLYSGVKAILERIIQEKAGKHQEVRVMQIFQAVTLQRPQVVCIAQLIEKISKNLPVALGRAFPEILPEVYEEIFLRSVVVEQGIVHID